MKVVILYLVCAQLLYVPYVSAAEKVNALVSSGSKNEFIDNNQGNEEVGGNGFSRTENSADPVGKSQQRLDLELDLGIEVDIELDVGNSPS